MRQVVLQGNRDLDIILAALFSQPVKGLEQLRLFDKVLGALENADVHLEYAESGEVEIFKRTPDGSIVMEGNQPKRASYLKKAPVQVDLPDGVASWLKGRMDQVDWNGGAARHVLRLIAQLAADGEKGEELAPKAGGGAGA